VVCLDRSLNELSPAADDLEVSNGTLLDTSLPFLVIFDPSHELERLLILFRSWYMLVKVDLPIEQLHYAAWACFCLALPLINLPVDVSPLINDGLVPV
jgi:hypothetical protein